MIRYAALLSVLLLPVVAFAQTEPGSPGPYVIDVRGAMLSIPNAGEFYPALPTAATIPGRAFGLDVGAHVFGKRLGGSTLGLGANVTVVHGKVGPPDVSATAFTLAPQVSLNFGSSDGWSYVGGGYGLGKISTLVAGSPDATVETGNLGTLNFGGGARWFVNPHVAAGFDVRFYRFGASGDAGTPATMHVALSVGMSVR